MAVLGKWLTDAEPTMEVVQVASLALEQRFAAVRHFLPLAAYLADEDVEHVHQLRVATRRGLAAVELFEEFLPAKRARWMRKTLKAIRKSAGEARDLDVFIARFEKSDDAAAAALVKRLRRQRDVAQPAIAQCASPLLEQETFRRQAAKLLRRIEANIQEEAPLRYGDWAKALVVAEWCRFGDSAPPVKASPEALHPFRVAAKRFRYALELLCSGLPSAAREEVYPVIEEIQQKLGEIQDHVVAVDKLVDWQHLVKKKREQRWLTQLAEQERKQAAAKSTAFRDWWRPDRLDDRLMAFAESGT